MHRTISPFHISTIPSRDINSEISFGFNACRPAIVMGQVLGIISWDFSEKSQTPTKPLRWKNILSLVYKSAAKVIISCIFLLHLKNSFLITSNYSAIRMIVHNATFFVPIGFMLSMHIFFTVEIKRFYNLIQVLNTTDKLIGQRLKKCSFLFNPMVLQVALTTANLTLYMVYVLQHSEHVTIDTLYTVMEFSHDVFVCAFFIITANVCAECFSTVNTELKETIALQTNGLSEYLDHVYSKYKQIYKLVDAEQEAFSLVITGMIPRTALDLCLCGYFALTAGVFSSYAAFYSTITIVFIHRLFIICAEAERITTMAALALKTLNDIHPKKMSCAEKFQIVILCNKLSQNPLQIVAAAKLFVVNMGTFTTIVATIATYLIVLLQFNSHEPNNGISSNITMNNVTYG